MGGGGGANSVTHTQSYSVCIAERDKLIVLAFMFTFLIEPRGPNPITLSPFDVVHVAWLVSMKLLSGEITMVSLVFLSNRTSGTPPCSPPGILLR